MKDTFGKDRGSCEHAECSTVQSECPEFMTVGNGTTLSCAYCCHAARFHVIKSLGEESIVIADSEDPMTSDKRDLEIDVNAEDISSSCEADVLCFPSTSTPKSKPRPKCSTESVDNPPPYKKICLNVNSFAETSKTSVNVVSDMSISDARKEVQLIMQCCICDFESINYKLFRTHCRRFHLKSKMKIKCSICCKVFWHFTSFKEHACDGIPISSVNEGLSEALYVSNCDLHETSHDPGNMSICSDISVAKNSFDSERNIFIKLCLKLEGVHSASSIVLNEVVRSVQNVLELSGVMTEQKKHFFDTLASSCRRKFLYKSLGIFVGPEKVTFENRECGYIIHLPDLLQTLGRNPLYFKYFKNSLENSNNDIFKDTTQSTGFLNHPGMLLHQNNNIAISLYNDDVEFCNPIGMKKGIHKLTLLYCTFLNVPIQHRSKLHHMHLVGVIKSSLFKIPEKRSLFLTSFITEINSLQINGIMINNEKFFGFLFSYVGDALAVHQLLGFKESFGPKIKYPCRTCKIKYKDIPFIDNHETCQLRSISDHNNDLERLKCLKQQNKNKEHQNLSKELGINRASPLSEINNFSIFSHVLYDPLHLLFEGILRKQIPIILKSLSVKNLITRENLNIALSSFKFHNSIITTKYPRPLNNDFAITSTAAAMHTLITHLPLFLKDISLEDEHKQCLITLLNICKIIWAPNTTIDAILQLQRLVEINHEILYKLYKVNGFIPKHHMLIHLVEQLREYGPGRWLSTTRGEAKHFIAKRKRYFNYKNMAYSVANVFQVNQAHSLYDNNLQILDDELSFEVVRVIDASVDKHLKNLSCTGMFEELKFLRVNGVNYKKDYLVITNENHDHPVFSIIKDFYIDSEKHALLLCIKTHSFYSSNLCAYEILPLLDYHLVRVSDLCHYKPMPSYYFKGKFIVIVTDSRHIGHLI